ncbi:ribonuclease domain-containing protein, partial [Leptospira sp. SA-E8]|uniref:ribonuclease domain-containing protein n=1 Tax=Leptospira sp. SA-E8 TaxID=3422259 RepID=UPI003EB69813
QAERDELEYRQLHSKETQWIEDNAGSFAKLYGISEEQAEARLAQQAFRQVQFGAEGGATSWDATASAYLKEAGPQPLTNGGYMFYGLPDQKADATMYLDSAIQNADFYAKNGLQQPTAAELQAAAQRDASLRAKLDTATKAALAASATLTLAGLTPAALNWALTNPIEATTSGIISAETAAAITSGAVTPSTLAPMLGSGGTKVVTAMEQAASGSPTSTRFVNGVAVVDRQTGAVFNGTVDLQPTFDRIAAGATGLSRNDGSVFRNGQGLLPSKPPGYYTEYVVPTPGISGPGPQRIVTGQNGEMFYTQDHYLTFIPVKKP